MYIHMWACSASHKCDVVDDNHRIRCCAPAQCCSACCLPVRDACALCCWWCATGVNLHFCATPPPKASFPWFCVPLAPISIPFIHSTGRAGHSVLFPLYCWRAQRTLLPDDPHETYPRENGRPVRREIEREREHPPCTTVGHQLQRGPPRSSTIHTSTHNCICEHACECKRMYMYIYAREFELTPCTPNEHIWHTCCLYLFDGVRACNLRVCCVVCATMKRHVLCVEQRQR